MRYHEIVCQDVEVSESLEDETSTDNAKSLDSETFLTSDNYVNEQADLLRVYTIDDPELLTAVRRYTEASTINAALRKGRKLGRVLAPQHASLMRLKEFDRSLPEEHYVYSGMGTLDPEDIIQDGVLTSDAFISASLSSEVAAKNNNFRREKKGKSTDYLLSFRLPEGYRDCYYLGPYSTSPGELEMLIFPGCTFRVTGRKTYALDDGVTRVIYSLEPSREDDSKI